MAKPKISATMAIALAEASENAGQLIRYHGGLWAKRNAERDHYGNPIDHCGTSTIEALVKRGEMVYTEWKEGRNGRFPVVATVTELAKQMAETE